MKLEDMRKIAEARGKVLGPFDQHGLEFISAMTANIDKLLDVVEAAKKINLLELNCTSGFVDECKPCNLKKALEKLENIK